MGHLDSGERCWEVETRWSVRELLGRILFSIISFLLSSISLITSFNTYRVQGFRSMGSEMPFGSINNLLLLPFAKSDSQILLTHQSSPANLHILYVQPQRHLSENFSDVIFGTKSINFAITMALSRHFIGHCPLFLFFFLLQIMIAIFQGCTMGSGLPQLDLYLKMKYFRSARNILSKSLLAVDDHFLCQRSFFPWAYTNFVNRSIFVPETFGAKIQSYNI